MKNYTIALFFTVMIYAVLVGTVADSRAEDFTDKARKPVEEAIDIRRNTQKSEDKWAAEKEKLKAQYEALEQRIKKQAEVNKDLESDLIQHTRAVDSLRRKLTEMSKISEEIEPYILETYASIKEHVLEGPPFLTEERKERISKLGEIIEDSQVRISERFRRLTETLLIEAEYGGTIEVYLENIRINEKEIQMRIFRLGRLSLFCQSLDKEMTGVYNVATQQWEVLPEKYNNEIDKAIEIGAKRRPVELVNLPLGRILVK